MHNSAASKELSGNEPADRVTEKMVVMGRKRSRGRRIVNVVVAIVAMAIAAIIFGNIYLQTLEPGFEWK